jgi:S1-C subfamily serine protease
MRFHLCVAILAALGIALGLTVPAAAQPAGAPAYLGVMLAPGEEGKAGVVIREVTPGSPAEKAGMKAGDRVAKVGDHEVKDVDAFMKAVSTHKPGDKLALTVERDGKEQTLTATLGERPAATARPDQPMPVPQRAPAFLGVQMAPLTPELRTQLKVNADAGAVIAEVVPGSPAEKAGLKRDDVVTAANDRPVRSPEDLREAVQQTGAGHELALAVSRGGEKVTVKASPQAGTVGYFLTPGDERSPSVDVGSMIDQGRRIRELERRVAELEKRLQDLDRRPQPGK